ncbi:MAG: hypothetical protein K1X75_09160 [Leptospirales bacterium]|nr:hypothetical protein [Leptospirales bacterium]
MALTDSGEQRLRVFLYEQSRGRSGNTWQAEERWLISGPDGAMAAGGALLENEERRLERALSEGRFRCNGDLFRGGRLFDAEEHIDLRFGPLAEASAIEAGLAWRKLGAGVAQMASPGIQGPVQLVAEELFIPIANPFAAGANDLFLQSETLVLLLPGDLMLLYEGPPAGIMKRLYSSSSARLLSSSGQLSPATFQWEASSAADATLAPAGVAAVAEWLSAVLTSGDSRCQLALRRTRLVDFYSLSRGSSSIALLDGQAYCQSNRFAVRGLLRRWPAEAP